MTNILSKWASNRGAFLTALVVIGGFGVWLLFLAAIGFHFNMVPIDALNHMAGQPMILRFPDEAILGVPVERFYTWSALVGGLFALVFVLYGFFHLPPRTPDSKIDAEGSRKLARKP